MNYLNQAISEGDIKYKTIYFQIYIVLVPRVMLHVLHIYY